VNIPYIYTALIDVLSYRQKLDQDINSGGFAFKTDLESALSVFDSVNSAVFGVQAISDTIILTCATHENFEEFLGILKSVSIAFLERGLYIRGGVAYSRHFQSGRLTYSHAVAKAYEIENKNAIYPRILLDKNIIDMYKRGGNLPTIFGKNLLAEQNGVSFINILDQTNWPNIFEFAAKMYEKDKSRLLSNESAIAKHNWFENYLFSSPFRDHTRIRYIQPITLT
jgi:hypothetical protein